MPYGPLLPREYIRIEYHPNSGLPARIVSLDPELPNSTGSEDDSVLEPSAPRAADGQRPSPWAPFASRADFVFAETMVKAQASKKTVNTFLDGLHGLFSNAPSNVSFRVYDDMAHALNNARVFVTDVSVHLYSLARR